MSLVIRDVTATDAESICRIYNPHVRNTVVTFEEEEVTPQQMQERIAGITASYPWLVAECDGAIAAYAYASKWRERPAYRYAAESTVYVDDAAQGRGIGTTLYKALLDRLAKAPVRSALGVIALPNDASVALHEKCGFKKAGHFERVGFKFGHWVDVGFWQIVW